MAPKATRAARVCGLPDWPILPLVARFWARYPAERFSRLSNFLKHVVRCANDRFEENHCDDAESWAILVLSSALLKAARRRNEDDAPEPMGHFLWHIEKPMRRQLDDFASPNLDLLRDALERELGRTLDELLDQGERENRELLVSPLTERLQRLEYFLEEWERSAPLSPRRSPAAAPPSPPPPISEAPAPAPSIPDPPRRCGLSVADWNRARSTPAITPERQGELEQLARQIAERRVAGDPFGAAIVDHVRRDELARLVREELEQLRAAPHQGEPIRTAVNQDPAAVGFRVLRGGPTCA